MNQDALNKLLAENYFQKMNKHAHTLVQIASAYDEDELEDALSCLFSDAAVVALANSDCNNGVGDDGSTLALDVLILKIKECESDDVLEYCYLILNKLLTKNSQFKSVVDQAYAGVCGKDNLLAAIKNYEYKEILEQILKIHP